MKKKNKKIIIVCVVLVALVLLFIGKSISKNKERSNAVPSLGERNYEESYRKYLSSNGYDGTVSTKEAVVNLHDFILSDGMVAMIGEEGILTEDEGMITWSFSAPESGFYNLALGYIALPGTTSDIQRKIYIDGEIPYDALSQVVLKRWWSDEDIRSKNDNEIRPKANELYTDTIWYVEDYQRRNNEPLLFYLEKGNHTISFEVIKEPLEITSITFKAYEWADSYERVLADWKSKYTAYTGETLICQAERREGNTTNIIKSSSSINIQTNYSDSALEPYHPYRIIYNTIGAANWAQPGDSITWEVEVPQEGLYELTFKARQNRNRGVTSYRRVYVNGEVPYDEMTAVGFDYESKMNHYRIVDEDGKPYLFYLHTGKNTITLENVMGPMGGIISQVEESLKALNQAYLDVIKLTGQVPSKFIDYEINKKLPNFAATMAEESENLYATIDAIIAITGEKGENTSLLEKMAVEAERLSLDPEHVTEELAQFKNNISALGTWLVNVADMPLEVDYIALSGEGKKLPSANESSFAGMKKSITRFFASFVVKESQITEDVGSGESTIKVWMASFGKEQAQMIQNMIDESFTPESNIQVNLQLIPVDVVLRAALAGTGPDVVIGLSEGTLQDFAIRNAISDVSVMDGYQEIKERFPQSTIDAATFQGGIYGVPEQANYMMLFVRNDIFDELELEYPKTWTEFRELIPLLQRNNYNAYIPNLQGATSTASDMNLYLSMVLQNGGSIYLGEGEDFGIASGLTEDEGMKAFKDYTDFFTSYGLGVHVDFTNRFRAGEIPIGVISYTTFCQLEIFAPEIKGLWSFYPVPGVLREDGTIDNSFLVSTVQTVIMAKSKKQEQAWEFVKWWTGTEAQLEFANSLEALMGTSARYAPADPEVLVQLPWSNTELKALMAQFESTVGISAVPGNYMTARMVQYSFNDVVNEQANPRETLYLNIKDIDQELYRKRDELGLSVIE